MGGRCGARSVVNRAVAAEMRSCGVVPSGEAWLAWRAGERDVAVLLGMNGRDGLVLAVSARRAVAVPVPAVVASAVVSVVERPVGFRLVDPLALRAGDRVLEGGWVAAGPGLLDPESGGVWVASLSGGDREVAAGVPLGVVRRRRAPEHVRAASEAYRDARDAWQVKRDSDTPAPLSVPGVEGSGVACYQVEDAAYRVAVPPPVFKDFLRDAVESLRDVS